MTEVRIFIAHSKGLSNDDLGMLQNAVIAALDAVNQGRRAVRTMLGRDDYERNAGRLGSWDAWIRDVATGVHYVTREPRYHGFVVAAGPVGKATAEMLRLALNAGKRVSILKDDGTLVPASRVETLDNRNFQAGWIVI